MDVLSKCHLYQMSSDSGMFENPFREGGKLSRDAEVIIDALKTGKLSVISNQVMMIMIMIMVMMMSSVIRSERPKRQGKSM